MAQESEYTKTILCLANSRKMSGRCLAGKEVVGDKIGGWVRPVSARPYEEISEADRRYKDGTTAALLDVIAIPMVKPKPGTYQTENHLIAEQFYWKRVGAATKRQLETCVDQVSGPLWINGHSSSNGPNDRIPEAAASELRSSLLLIRPLELRVRVAPKGDPNAPEKRSVRALFELDKAQYNLGLTDAAIERKYLQGKNGTFPVEDALLCVSLGEPFNGYVYKLAAALITPDRIGKRDD